jgi:hypothetical protein
MRAVAQAGRVRRQCRLVGDDEPMLQVGPMRRGSSPQYSTPNSRLPSSAIRTGSSGSGASPVSSSSSVAASRSVVRRGKLQRLPNRRRTGYAVSPGGRKASHDGESLVRADHAPNGVRPLLVHANATGRNVAKCVRFRVAVGCAMPYLDHCAVAGGRVGRGRADEL